MYTILVWDLLQPYPLLLLFIAVGLALVWRKPAGHRAPLLGLTIGFVVLVILSIPAVAYYIRGTLEWRYAPLEHRPKDVEALVVLSSSVRPPDGPQIHAVMDTQTMDCLLRAAELYREGEPCPIIVSGGKPDPRQPGPAYAVPMCDYLVRLGIPATDILLEDQSRTTHENAVGSCRLLKERHLHKIVLLADAAHVVRATACFRKQGVEVVPCGCRCIATPHAPARRWFWPRAEAIVENERSGHEWLGMAWYWLCGRL
jgi:uncharacterized SAM-binding protein YcdF (DUF218 family)